jgi:hypothetical protein
MVTTATGMETILNAYSHAQTDGVFRPLNVNWDTLPTSFFPLDAESELWEFAEHAIPHVLEQMIKGAPRIRMDDLAKAMIPHYDRMRPDYKGQLKQKIQNVMDHASRAQFSAYLQRSPRAAAGVMQTPTWDVIANPLVGMADKRQRAWKSMQKKHQSLIEHFKNPQRQEVLEMDEGEAVR